jgi:3D (Asp-Asp-Asp) domain-containing protein/LysM repeat protein
MALKKKIFLVLMLLVLAGSIVLSLKRSTTADNPSGEIKHFSRKLVQEKLRIQNGLTLEEFIDQHILLGSRIKKNKILSMKSLQTAEIPMQERALNLEQDGNETWTYEPGVELLYEVTWGDRLDVLAKRYKTTPYKIARLNALPEDAILRIGQKIRILPEQPSTYRVRPGDNLTVIARRFDVEQMEIERLNHLNSDRSIWVGQKLILPATQKKIDAMLATIEKKQKEEAERRRHYQHQLFSRIEEQKRQRQIAATKARAEKRAQEKKLQAQQAREHRSRLARAQRAFKVTGSSKFKHKMRVVATAYTSHRSQTDSTPFLAAWNNRIRPGMKIIAVSPDLIRRYGITNGVRVKIGGLPGTYVVRDKMNPRLHNHIDIYMGTNRRRALRWGRRRVVLYW